MGLYFVRIGSLGDLFVAQADAAFCRNDRVIARTYRGIELAQIVSPCRSREAATTVQILRKTTHQDELLLRRLERHKRDAVEACQAALAEAGSSAVLLEVDQVFDGETLVMHFLGNVDPVAERITRDVTERYESIVRTKHFAKLLRDGCGPDCGTENGSGCGTGGGCEGCASAVGCLVKSATPYQDRVNEF
ncbi:hypothetical protein [Novipirellula aureliae]|nr:hypothetical protein [Novipirellula aureliae]